MYVYIYSCVLSVLSFTGMYIRAVVAYYLFSSIASFLCKVSRTSFNSYTLWSSGIELERLLFFLSFDYNCRCIHFVELIGVDRFMPQGRFFFVSIVFSFLFSFRCACVAYPKDIPMFHSISTIYTGAIWSERECAEMFGFFFFYTADARRLLLDYGFIGFPLRKDFPLTGFFEVAYSTISASLEIRPIILPQQYRFFRTLKAWRFL